MSSHRNIQAPRAPKVRQSCDTCQASKIRCGQERPCCRRCAKYNIECVYSVSRRAGRPRPRKTVDPTTPVALSPTQLQSPRNLQTILPTPDETSPTHEEYGSCLASPPQDSVRPMPEATRRDSTQNHELEKRQYHDLLLKSPQDDRSHSHRINLFAENHSPNTNHCDRNSNEFEAGLARSNSSISISSSNNNSSSRNDGSSNRSDPINAVNSCQNNYFTPGVEMCQPTSLLRDLDSTQFPNFFFSDTNLINDQMDFDVLMTPLPDCVALPVNAFPEASVASPPATTTVKVPQGCHCTTMLLQHLGEISVPKSGMGSGCNDGASFVSAVQHSRVLLDDCFVILSCPSCKTRMSSALVVCQAMEELSVTLGMGTLWVEGTGSCEQDRCLLLSNLAKDEVPMRCGSYAVRGVDRQVLLRTLMMNRLTEMQRAMGKLCQSVEMLSSSCRATCAGMAAELQKRVSFKVDLFRAAAAQTQQGRH
ncbi:hypothetical protein J1614_010418 [Plenodomus biglobosus]|nr:hypothetical protein J1614_010418 [Plenodomus biglobosus]